MAYSLTFSASALKELKKLDLPVKRRIEKTLTLLLSLDNPYTKLEEYTGSLRGFWKLRIGDYRLVLDVQKKNINIDVIKIGHRKNIYKNN